MDKEDEKDKAIAPGVPSHKQEEIDNARRPRRRAEHRQEEGGAEEVQTAEKRKRKRKIQAI